MAKEVAAFRMCLRRTETHKDLWAAVAETKNTNGSFLSLIVQTQERKCAEAMMAYFKAKGLSVDVYTYDGCQVRGKDVVTDAMLEECEKQIFEATSWRVTLKIKPFADVIESIHTNADALELAYKDMKTEWEKDHFYFEPTNTIVKVGRDGRLNHYGI
jgi:hypothetical protein